MATTFNPLPFKEAMTALQQRVDNPLPSGHWAEVWQTEHARAFTVARSAGYDILGDVADGLKKALAEGKTFQDFAKDITPVLQEKGWWGEKDGVQLGSPRRLKTIFDVNMRTARAAGHWDQIERRKAEEAKFGRTLYLRYVAVVDDRTRADHRTWHGTVLPADDPWWTTHTPPNGWHCRCTVQSLTERDLTRYGYTPSAGPPYSGPDKQWKNPTTGEIIAVPAGIDPGWAYNPGQAAAPISGAVTKLDRLPAAAGARGTDLIAPIAENYQAMVTKIGDRLDQGRVKNTGERLPVGIMSPKVVQALTAIGETPSAAGLWITDKNLTHMMRDAKTAAKTKAGLPKGLLLDDLLRLPQVLATPESVYWDKDTRSVLYVFSSESRPGSKGKYAVRVNWQDRGTKQPTNTILTGGWEDTFPAARYTRLDD